MNKTASNHNQKTSLGGPAKVFEEMAQAIRAGQKYEDVLNEFGFAESTPNCLQQKNEPVVCLMGGFGTAFDTPKTKRAYTYDKQPVNGPAWKLGEACTKAHRGQAGDYIDRGLLLLKALKDEGFGVFDLGAEYPDPAFAVNKQDRLDTARYRYLRNNGDGFDISVREEGDEGEEWVTGYPPAELDSAIDSAIAAAEKSRRNS